MHAKTSSRFVITSIVVGLSLALCGTMVHAQVPVGPGKPEDNGLAPKADTVYINTPATINNARTESLGVAIANNGNVIVGWEDDGDALMDLEAVWTLYAPNGSSLTPDTEITTIDPNFAGQTLTSKFLSYFRKDGSAISGRTSWGPKIKANLFGAGIGMGATAFDLGIEVVELAPIQFNAAGENAGDFPAVQLLGNDGKPIGILSGVDEAYAERDGDIRIGDWEYLSNGNIVIVGESRQKPDLVNIYGGIAENNHAIFRIVDPTGKEVKAVTLVSEMPDGNEIWHGVGVTQDGFAVRFNQGGAKVRIFDNAGNAKTINLDLATLTGNPGPAGGGRGDSAGFHGNGKDAYVVANGSGTEVWVTVLNADGTLRYAKSVIDDVALVGPGRMDAAIDGAGRVIVVFSDKSGTAGTVDLVMGRLLDPTGKPLGGTFYVGETELPDPATLEARRPRVAWRENLVAIVWESQNSPDNVGVRTVAARLFTTFKPGSLESAGLTRIVPDTPINIPAQDNLGNWEPYISVLGNSTFLLEGNTFAEGGATDMRYVVAFQPAAGGAMKLGEGFFADNGTPYKGSINASRQNGNPGRVAGDKRPGAVNFIVGGEASPHGFTEFQSDTRWTVNGIYSDVNRYGVVQTFSLDPTALVQTSLSKAFDAVNGQNTAAFSGNVPEVSRFGGDLTALDNGNFVVVIDDRSNMVVPARATTGAIITPTGQVVKAGFAVEERDIWSNVAAFKGGFCVRVHDNLHFYDNAGNPLGVVNQNTSGESFDAGRGDGTRIAAHINSPYVFLAGKVAGANLVKVAAWDARDQSFAGVAIVSEPAFAGSFDRVNLAADALNRVTVSWVSQPAGYEQQQVAARVLAFDGATKSFSALTPSFLPFINAAQTGGIRSRQMSVAMTTKQICIAAKGEINLENKPQNEANSPREINFYTVFMHPDPKDDPTPPAPPTTPGKPEDNGLPPKSATVYINLPPVQTPPESINNDNTESLGVAIASNGNVIVGWEDDGDALTDLEAVWTLFNPSGASITPDTLITTLNPEFAGQTLTSKFLSYFRKDGSAVSGRTSWGPKMKANLFGDGIGMGATSFELGLEVVELFDLNMDAGGGGDFPSVQLLNNNGQPLGIVSGLSDADAEPAGNVRIGDWDYLSNGNIVIVGESRQDADLETRFGGPAPNRHAVYRIVTPTGQEVKGLSLVSETPDRVEIWHGVGVTANGFAVRFALGGRTTVRLFDNNGTPITGNIDLATLTGQAATAGGGRGDGAGFHGNGRDAYVAVNSSGAQGVFVTVLNANGTLRWSRNATEGFDLRGADRLDAAIDPAGRVLVVFDDANETGGAFRLVQGRLFDAAGNPIGGTFYISEKETAATATMESRRPRAAWRGDTVAVVWQSKNAVAGDIVPEVVALRLFTIPAVVPPELVITSITAAGNNVTIEWSGGTGPFLLQRKSSLADAAWVDFATTPNRSITVPRQGLAGFFRVSDQAPTAVTLLTVSLSGAAERPNPVTTSGTGLGTLSLKGNTLTYHISYSGLSSAASAAHIHGPATTEQAAGVMVPLSGAAGTAGVLSGTLTLSDSQKADLLAGRTYVNIHTANFGGGEIRGQITP